MNPDNPTPEANVTLLIVSAINVTVYPETCEGTVMVMGVVFCNSTVAPLWVEPNEKLPVSTSNENSESVIFPTVDSPVTFIPVLTSPPPPPVIKPLGFDAG